MENVIDPETIESWREAGQIASKALLYGKGLIVKGKSMREVLDKIEKKIVSLGAECSFPPQISCDSTAAHYCPTDEEDILFNAEVASLDVGVHVDGCQGDNALTVDLSGKYKDLVKASEEALKNAIKEIDVGVKTSQIGKVICETIQSHGFEPIRNLSGHGMNEWQIHTWPTIPNFDNGSSDEISEGMILAIEPFATTGKGFIEEKGIATVFSQVKNTGGRSLYAREILKTIKDLNGLPFTTRWLTRELGTAKVKMGMNELIRLGVIHQYPPLVERGGGICSQAEKTVYIGDKVEVLTER